MQAVWCVRVCGVCKPSVCVCVCKPGVFGVFGVLCVCGVCVCVVCKPCLCVCGLHAVFLCVLGGEHAVCVGRGCAGRVV